MAKAAVRQSSEIRYTIRAIASECWMVQQEFETSQQAEMRAVFGVYLLETREVWAPCLNNGRGIGLAAAPRDLAGFTELGNAVIQSERIASYIK